MDNKLVIASIVAAILVVAVLGFSIQKNLNGNVVNSLPVKITYQNMGQMLSTNSLVNALPEGAVLSLRFYNFNSGVRQWEREYILKKGNVTEGIADKPDITIVIHSKYLGSLTDQNFCSIIKTANQNGDLGTETGLSNMALLWKFAKVLKYKECFGI